MLDEAGFTDAVIAASNDLDEFLINDLKIQGAAITSWGVGTNLITSKDCPSSEAYTNLPPSRTRTVNSFQRSRSLKMSRDHKSGQQDHLPHLRQGDRKDARGSDLFVGEEYDTSKDLLLFDPNATWKKTRLEGGTYTMKEIFKTSLHPRRMQVQLSVCTGDRRPLQTREGDSLGRNKTSLQPAQSICRPLSEALRPRRPSF